MSRIAFIFPGQGAQTCGMGKDFYEQTETGRKVFDRASDLLGFSVPELCFEPNDRLDITEYTQAAMVTTSIAMMKVLEERGIHPDVAAGLSLGEYCALAAAGVMSEDDAIRTVRQRGILMQEEVPAGEGAMAAVLALDASVIEEITSSMEGVWIANYNCPGQIVISGKKAAVEEACERLGSRSQESHFTECKRSLSLRYAHRSRRKAGRGTFRSRGKCSQDPVCCQRNRRVCDRGSSGKGASDPSGIFFCKMAAERRGYAGRWRGYLYRDWTGTYADWLYA